MAKVLHYLSVFMLIATGASAKEVGLQSTLVGNQILEVKQTTQLTTSEDGDAWFASVSPDGKHVVFYANHGLNHGLDLELGLVKTNGQSKPVVVVKGKENPYGMLDYDDKPASGEVVKPEFPVEWSPDSRMFAMGCRRVLWEGDNHTDYPYVMVIDTNCRQRAAVGLPETADIPRGMAFSPDSSKVAVSYTVDEKRDDGSHRGAQKLLVLDVYKNTSQEVPWQLETRGRVVEWNRGAKPIICRIYDGEDTYAAFALDGETEQVAAPWTERSELSPNGSLRVRQPDSSPPTVVSDSKRLGSDAISPYQQTRDTATKIENAQTGALVCSITDPGVRFERWSPNGKEILFRNGNLPVRGLAGSDVRPVSPLWLGNIETGTLRGLCVSLDANMPTISSDGNTIAYISGARVWVGQLERRAPTTEEKLAYGLPLDEQEEKDILLGQARLIANRIEGYRDEDGKDILPEESVLRQRIGENDEVSPFLCPGTRNEVFHYLGTGLSLSAIEDRYATPVAELNSNYAWKIVIYADGHVKVVPK